MSPHSRNRAVGEQLGRGRRLDDILADMHMVAEGVKTATVALELAERRGSTFPLRGDRQGGHWRDRTERGLLGAYPGRS